MNAEPDMQSHHISQLIHRSPSEVYDFAAEPANLARWASGLAQSPIRQQGDQLLVESPMGEVTVRFVPRNELGVLDHDVTLPTGATVTNPVRVLAHPNGAEVLFTIRQLGMTDEEFERDARTVAEDLAQLKALLEG